MRLIDRLNELRQQIRDADKWLWRLWLDGFKVDIRSWAEKHLDSLQRRLSGGVDTKSLRSPTGRHLSNRVRRAPDRNDFIGAWLAVARGLEQFVSLCATAEPPIFDIMLKVGGLPSNMPPPDSKLRRQLSNVDLSFGGLRETVVAAATEDFEQARRDWRIIDGFIDAAETIDWNAATTSWGAKVKSVVGGGPDPPSIRARKAQRVRRVPPPKFIVTLRTLWHEPVARAVMLAVLIAFRQSENFSNIITEFLAGAAWWFEGLPHP